MQTVLSIPGNVKPLNEIYVIVSRDKSGNEGVLACSTHLGITPLFAASESVKAAIQSLFKEQIAKTMPGTGHTAHLLKFTSREELPL